MSAEPSSKPDVVARVCDALLRDDVALARAVARAECPFVPGENAGRKYTELESMRIFQRDGFVDRYSGDRLVFPGTLRLLSKLMPEEFPAHKNWKMTESHIFFWELFPTIDHVVPVARGGADAESNWVTTSMVRNSAKSNWTLEELSWTLRAVGASGEWDGLVGWFLAFVRTHPEHTADNYLARWHRAAMGALA